MRVADVLKSNRQSLATCIPEESIATICTRLSALNIGAFPVCDAHGTLVGIISERDVVRAFAKDGARLADMHVRDLMTRGVTTCTQETTKLASSFVRHARNTCCGSKSWVRLGTTAATTSFSPGAPDAAFTP